MSQGLILKFDHTEIPSLGTGFVLKGTVTCDGCGMQFHIYHHAAHPEDDLEQSGWLQTQLARDHKSGQPHAYSFHYPW